MYSRREFGKLALVGLPAATAWPSWTTALIAAPKPNSKWAGVQVGLNVPYSLGNNTMSGEETLSRCVQLGVSAVELRSQPVEIFLGSPALTGAKTAAAAVGNAPAGMTPEREAARKAAASELRAWRLGVSMKKVKEFKKLYDDAGVAIEIVKFDNYNIYTVTDEEVDYAFQMAKALGARAISCEISSPDTTRLGRFADKHNLMVGYHGHETTTPEHWEEAFAQAKHNGANLDIGHFVAGNNTSPVPFLEKHHDRITHLHIKDRKLKGGPNMPFGQGDTPIKEVLQLLRDRKWKIQATIEFEYPVPTGSDRMAEIAKCVEYCRTCLA